jgi:hypothetical protein
VLKGSGWFCEVLAGFHKFSEVFRRFFLPIFGKMSPVQLGSTPHSVFRDIHWFFVQFWSCDCFGTIFGRFRCVIKGSGWVSEVLRGFSGFSPVFRSSSSYFGAMALSSRFLEGWNCLPGFWGILFVFDRLILGRFS